MPAAEREAIIMPFGDLTVSQGTIVNWLKAEGDAVTAGEVVAEIETDKAVIEIEAPIAGTLGAIERKKGEVVPSSLPPGSPSPYAQPPRAQSGENGQAQSQDQGNGKQKQKKHHGNNENPDIGEGPQQQQ